MTKNTNDNRAEPGRLPIGAAVALGLLLVAAVYVGAPAAGNSAAGYAAASATDSATHSAIEAPSTGLLGPGNERASVDLAALEDRVNAVRGAYAAVDAFYAAEVAPIERVLLRYRDDDTTLVSRIAAAVVREARAADLEPRLLLGVLLVENPWLDPSARSFVGAVGLMQVMPVHTGGWSCGFDLEHIDTNVCLGARVFAHYLDRVGGDIETALLRYNGCVNGTNTPTCHQYPSRVLARAGGPSVLAWMGQAPSAASP